MVTTETLPCKKVKGRYCIWSLKKTCSRKYPYDHVVITVARWQFRRWSVVARRLLSSSFPATAPTNMMVLCAHGSPTMKDSTDS